MKNQTKILGPFAPRKLNKLVHRDTILNLIDRYSARYPDEQETSERLRAFVVANEDCFKRELEIGHVTGSAWILNAKADAALLTHHRKLNIWVQLGGHADGDANIQRVAEREAEEESGLKDLNVVATDIFDIDIHEIPARKSEPAHFHYDCRFLLQAASEDYVVSDESHDLKWILLADMQSYTTEESVLRMVRKSADWI